MTAALPTSHQDLLERPLFAHLATVRPDGSPQSSAMWFAWDGSRVRFTHTSARQKYRNLLAEGRVAFHVQDPENPYRTLEVRGRVESMDPDKDAAFYSELQHRYGLDFPVFDADVRVEHGAALRTVRVLRFYDSNVVIVVKPENYVAVDGGLTESETVALTKLLEGQKAPE